jgi:hypothetical protein
MTVFIKATAIFFEVLFIGEERSYWVFVDSTSSYVVVSNYTLSKFEDMFVKEKTAA